VFRSSLRTHLLSPLRMRGLLIYLPPRPTLCSADGLPATKMTSKAAHPLLPKNSKLTERSDRALLLLASALRVPGRPLQERGFLCLHCGESCLPACVRFCFSCIRHALGVNRDLVDGSTRRVDPERGLRNQMLDA
jgi:hypothetical protein